MDKTMLGRFIAEIAKFGGWEKEKASQLASILLPYAESYATKARIEELNRLNNVVANTHHLGLVEDHIVVRLAELKKEGE